MEEKNIYTIVEDIAKVVKGFEDRLVKNEQLVLRSFSYLYAKIDENNKTENYSYQLHNLTTNIKQLEYTFNENLKAIRNDYSVLNNRLVDLESNNLNNDFQIPVKKKIKRKKRPWYWIFIKKREYNKLLEQKRLLEEEIERRKEQKRKEQEEIKRKQKEVLEEQRRKDEEIRKLKRAKAQKEMSNILAKIKKP